jgi:hypothetical protein
MHLFIYGNILGLHPYNLGKSLKVRCIVEERDKKRCNWPAAVTLVFRIHDVVELVPNWFTLRVLNRGGGRLGKEVQLTFSRDPGCRSSLTCFPLRAQVKMDGGRLGNEVQLTVSHDPGYMSSLTWFLLWVQVKRWVVGEVYLAGCKP